MNDENKEPEAELTPEETPASPEPEAAPPAEAPVEAAPEGTVDASKKIAAGICGILLGSLGVHKFILGYTKEGVIMLLVSILGGIFTCGVVTSIVWVVGLVEGIMYLTKSDEEFYKTYIANQKTWF